MYADGCINLSQPGLPTLLAFTLTSRGCSTSEESPEFPTRPYPRSCVCWQMLQPSLAWPTHSLTAHGRMSVAYPSQHGPHPILVLMCMPADAVAKPNLACLQNQFTQMPTRDAVLLGLACPSSGSCAPQQELWSSREVPQVLMPGLLLAPGLTHASGCSNPVWHGLPSQTLHVLASTTPWHCPDSSWLQLL